MFCISPKAKILILGVLFIAAGALASPVQEEQLYFQYQKELLGTGATAPTLNVKQEQICTDDNEACLSNMNIAIQALDKISAEMKMNRTSENKILAEIQRLKFAATSLSEQLQLYIILSKNLKIKDPHWENELDKSTQKALAQNTLSERDARVLLANKSVFKNLIWKKTYRSIEQFNLIKPAPIASKQALIDLVNIEPELDKYKSGRYKNKPRIYMFCRSDREYACLMIVKDRLGALVTIEDGSTLWTQPALGYSRQKKAYDQTNGDTPTGIFRIDGVMPNNDQQIIFGKYRRIILNFIAATEGESDQLALLPESSHAETWWQQAAVARDIGRGLFRIHGTGLRSSSGSSFYPLVPTSGCVAKRENTYDNEKFIDQRVLLDLLMTASGLTPTAENEENIRGLLYVVNIDNQKRNVAIDDLYSLGVISSTNSTISLK